MRDSCRLQLSEHEAIIRHGHSLSDSNQGTGADCRYRPNCCPESLSLSNSYWTKPLANRFKPGTSSCIGNRIGNQTELVQGISNNSQSILCKAGLGTIQTREFELYQHSAIITDWCPVISITRECLSIQRAWSMQRHASLFAFQAPSDS